MEIIKNALNEGRTALSEHESKEILASYQIPFSKEIAVDNAETLMKAVQEIG